MSITDGLDWIEHPNAFPAPLWGAKTPFGFYNIEETSASDSPAYEVRWREQIVAVKDGLPEAKEAAQADYEKRVIAAANVTTEIVKDAARYRYLRDHCSCHYPMTHEQPAEWSIGWEFQQSTPEEAYGSFDKWIDADIEAMRQRQAELDAEDAA